MPDLPSLDEPAAGALTIAYQPDGGVATENPPRFAWLPDLDETTCYILEIAADHGFAPAATTTFEAVRRNYFVPDRAFPAGTYWWRYAAADRTSGRRTSGWSRVREFTIPEGSTAHPLPSAADRLRAAARSHPRLWLGPDQVSAFATAVRADPAHCHFDRFFAGSVQPFLSRDPLPEPAPYPGGKRVATLWRQIYIDCQECLYGVRNVAIAGAVLGDVGMRGRAKAWLLAIADWDAGGTSSRAYNDEAAFRIAAALAWGYDWLHGELDETERARVRRALVARTRDLHHHVFAAARIHVFPYDSHAVRFLSAVLIPCAIALLHEEPEAQQWLDDTVEYLFSIYPPWGGADGGWAEGPHYWTLGMAYLLDAAGLLKGYLGIDLLARPFFRQTWKFPLYTKAPGTRRVSFGYDSTMGDPPSLKVGYNVRRLALAAGDGFGQWYFEQLIADDTGTAGLFYNYGWWDFAFEDMVVARDAGRIAPRAPRELPPLAAFRDVGWAAVQRNLADPARHLQLVFKSSPFGSLSHSHGDQNAFLLRACGEDLAIQSGHYVAFNSDMHRKWRRQTVSKNAILIEGRGQYADDDKALSRAAQGRLLEAREDGEVITLRGDATAAYRILTPEAQRVERELRLVGDRYLIVVDRIELAAPLPVSWRLHAEHPIAIGGTTFRFEGRRAGLYGHVIYASSGSPALTAVEGFPGIPDDDFKGLARHWHVEAALPAARRHALVTLLVPYPRGAPARVLHYIDDQGYDAHVHLVEADGREQVVTIQKAL